MVCVRNKKNWRLRWEDTALKTCMCCTAGLKIHTDGKTHTRASIADAMHNRLQLSQRCEEMKRAAVAVTLPRWFFLAPFLCGFCESMSCDP